MREEEELTITLPTNMTCMIKAWIITGQYTSESEAVIDALNALLRQQSAENRLIKKAFREAHPEIFDKLTKDSSADSAKSGEDKS